MPTGVGHSAIFISENGIVAVLGDEDQSVNGDIRKINRPLSFQRGHMGQIRGSDRYRREVAFTGGITFKYLPLFRCRSLINKLVDTLNLGPSEEN